MRRLDRVAGEVNPYLIILAVGLFILNLTCFVALEGSSLPITKISPGPSISTSPTTSSIGPVTLPSAAAARSSR
jgi:hypothetical protein